MRRDLITAILATLTLTLLLGAAYPLAVTGIAQLAMPDHANGSLLRRDGTVVGSRLVSQATDGPGYFQPRPSQTDHAANASGFRNLGPNERELADEFATRRDAYLERERSFATGLDAGDVPVDAVTNSGSGIDPEISIANARIQSYRVASQRGIDRDTVAALIRRHTSSRALGVFGEHGVNVLELNLELDEEHPLR